MYFNAEFFSDAESVNNWLRRFCFPQACLDIQFLRTLTEKNKTKRISMQHLPSITPLETGPSAKNSASKSC